MDLCQWNVMMRFVGAEIRRSEKILLHSRDLHSWNFAKVDQSHMNISGETKFFITIAITTVIILVAAVIFFSKPPKEVPLETLVPQEVWATGSANPKATLVEFSDFECPACASAQPFVKKVIEKYQDNLRFVYRQFPLFQHKNARFAAESAEAAGAQGKFWEMHDVLFKNQQNLSRETINGLGIELKLDMEKFTKELAEGKYKEKVEKDISDGIQLGVNSTPTFYLNGKKLALYNFDQLDSEIEKVINETKN